MLQSLFSMDLSSVNEAFFMIEFAAILLGLLLGGILSLYTCLALSLFFNKHPHSHLVCYLHRDEHAAPDIVRDFGQYRAPY